MVINRVAVYVYNYIIISCYNVGVYFTDAKMLWIDRESPKGSKQ